MLPEQGVVLGTKWRDRCSKKEHRWEQIRKKAQKM